MLLRKIGRYCVFAAFVGGLAACSTARVSETELASPRQVLFTEKVLPSGDILTLDVRSSGSEYRVFDGNSKKLIAYARSAIVSEDVEQSIFQGTLNIVSSPTGSFLIQEDVSESSPTMNCIYFKRNSENGFDVSYLDLPVAKWDRHPLAFEFPHIIKASDSHVTLLFPTSKKMRTMKISAIPSSVAPFVNL